MAGTVHRWFTVALPEGSRLHVSNHAVSQDPAATELSRIHSGFLLEWQVVNGSISFVIE